MTKSWLKDTAERVIATAAQGALAALVVTGWSLDTAYVAAGAAGLSLLKCFAALRVGDPDSASLNPSLVSGDGGHSDVELVILVATCLGVLLLLLGVTFR